MKILPFLLFVAVLLAAPLQTLRAADRLALVTGEDYLPFADSRLPGGGVATILVQHVLQLAGVASTVDFLPWRRGYEETLRGRYDGTFPYIRTTERERDFLYSDSLINVRQVVFMARDRTPAYRGLEGLHGQRICIALGYAAPPEIQRLIDLSLMERQTPASAAMCPGMVEAGRADFFIMDERIGEALVAKAGLQRAIAPVTGPPFGVSDIYFIVPRNRPDAAGLIARFNQALRQMQAGGDYQRLLVE